MIELKCKDGTEQHNQYFFPDLNCPYCTLMEEECCETGDFIYDGYGMIHEFCLNTKEKIYEPVREKYHRRDSSTSQYTYIPKKYKLFEHIITVNNKVTCIQIAANFAKI